MMKASCVRVAADNSAVKKRYYVRLPEVCADSLPFAEKELDGNVVRGVTEEIAVTEMHAKAKELRLGGAAVFFAAMEG